ncbi:MAG TPA: MFS transporter, partial [Acetobacteraceae bacterium]|nr:MFS transporter [Acetobacteraceae bacterium]
KRQCNEKERHPMPRQRWTMIILCFLACTINYIDRANLAVAAPYLRKDFGIDAAAMGFILSGFFWTYAVMQMPWGWFADKRGPRLALSIAVVWWSVFTAATAVARGFTSLMGCRLLLGIGEAGAYPAFTKVVADWFPRRERSFATSIYDSGSRTGAVLSLPIVSAIIAGLGWRASFIITGVLGLIWTVFWLFIYREPEQHPGVAPDELKRLQAERGRPEVIAGAKKLPWASLFRYRTVWAMMIGFFCLNFAIYFFITWFPTYLVQARGFSLTQLGTLGALPGVLAIPGGWFGGFASDSLYRRGWSLTAARKTCLVGGMLMSSVITLSAFAPNIYVCLALFALSYASLAFTGASIWSLPADVAPTQAHVASIGGIQNFASNLAGIVISTFTGLMLWITSGSFAVPLTAAGAICILGACVYLFMLGEIKPLPALDAPPAVPPAHATA